jgi:hypothetical protein
MGSMPVRTKLKADIRAAYATEEDVDGWEHVIDLIASGVTVSALSKKFGVSRSFFSTVLHSDRVGISERVKKAHKDAAEALLDMAQADVDDLADTATRDQVTLSRVRADTKIKLAALKDPERYQTKPDAPQVHISIGSLHFEALRAANRNSLPSGTHPSLPPAPVDAEIISEEPAHGHEDHAPAVTG